MPPFQTSIGILAAGDPRPGAKKQQFLLFFLFTSLNLAAEDCANFLFELGKRGVNYSTAHLACPLGITKLSLKAANKSETLCNAAQNFSSRPAVHLRGIKRSTEKVFLSHRMPKDSALDGRSISRAHGIIFSFGIILIMLLQSAGIITQERLCKCKRLRAQTGSASPV